MGAMLDLNAGLSYVRANMDDFDAGFHLVRRWPDEEPARARSAPE
jgi:hypothetical protein